MMQADAYERFLALHHGDRPFIMPNAWDAASAALLAEMGFAALGSSSAAIAWGLGRRDGLGAVSRSQAIDNAALLARFSGLPVNGDLEDGFGPSPDDCAATVEAAIAAGLAGLGIEDTTGEATKPIRNRDDAVARLRAAVGAARGRIVLTGRTDVLLHGGELDEAVARLIAFAEEGADVLYAPGLKRAEDVARVVAAVAPRPVNVLATPMLDHATLTALKVRRISLGATLYRAATAGLARSAEALLAGDLAGGTVGIPAARIEGWFA